MLGRIDGGTINQPALNVAGDAFRAFVLKDMGGLYLDLDIECFQHREHMLHGLDLVLQVAPLLSKDAEQFSIICFFFITLLQSQMRQKALSSPALHMDVAVAYRLIHGPGQARVLFLGASTFQDLPCWSVRLCISAAKLKPHGTNA